MTEVELERTFLAKSLPEGLFESPKKEIIDIYIPADAEHARLRVRKNGDKYTITKKIPVDQADASHHNEYTIELSKDEFDVLTKVKSRKLHKIRYFYDYQGKTAEIDVFEDELKGLIVVDFEFSSEDERDQFQLPDFCLADITQEKFIAGGVLAGKTYSDIEPELQRLGYHRIEL